MAIDIEKKVLSARIAVISISGRITAETSKQVKDEVKSLLSTGHNDLVFDLTKTVFIDSSGLSSIVSALKQTREIGGSLKLAGLQPEVQSIFRLTMLDRVFEMYPTVEAATDSIKN